ncbi:uroporphyrin-III C/tetrapyrrole (corrin/porphyrin) methyltransferase [Emticicia oligotrophica DSM 17448]|uniref:Uroporphyrin-III C/tetrapyrrole (Corrin/porphyrin) methyltransferase n=1 Tax=Emticicia oligotrophica (strain DSM 17448 / CIP 109782 / MTCC 6937 / GPTSA100-15) TaxID=929562 RepID=A0ABM5N313_EMTOG|nr:MULTISPECIES: SAM-dependent methyltransferase [Emticicia]AFK03847.1 uroporphyrin-III C/tetrapyrrole (corrin/porphyrin) methyltransferase [Emticicia oligotrophica DSM 17448]
MTLFLIPTILAPDTQETVLPTQIKAVVSELNVFFVEELRTARRFISSLKLNKVIDEITFYELNKDTPPEQTLAQLKKLKTDAGIISEAGCPGIADPGSVAVGYAHQLGHKVVPLVGPSSILMALMASGFNGQSFTFNGYLPIDKQQRIKSIRELEQLAKKKKQTQIFMETPFRNNQLLEDVLQNLNPETLLCIACNVTAPEEFIKTLRVKDWRKSKPDLHKKPTIFLLL